MLAEAQLSAGSTTLESKNALVRIPVAGKVCAYALDPHEVWKGYNTSKNYAAFVT
nr:helix-turn-helix domain-containing protein [Escherichia coli]